MIKEVRISYSPSQCILISRRRNRIKKTFIFLLELAFRFRFMRSAWLKITKVVLLHTNVDAFWNSEMDFLNFLAKNRVHFSNSRDSTDVDVTFVQLELNPKYDSVLIDVFDEALHHMKEINKEIHGPCVATLLYPNATKIKNPTDLNSFKEIPEMRVANNHYLFLTSIAAAVGARRIVEVGTASGTSLCAFLSASAVEFVDTFDIVPMDQNRNWVSPTSYATIQRFLETNSNRWTQHIANLTSDEIWDQYSRKFAAADLIFIDSSHSGQLETLIGKRMKGILRTNAIVIWDDIRVSSLVSFWQNLEMAKLDVGGFAHYSGTGISRFP